MQGLLAAGFAAGFFGVIYAMGAVDVQAVLDRIFGRVTPPAPLPLARVRRRRR